MSEFRSPTQRRDGRGSAERQGPLAALRDRVGSHAATDTVGHENDSWAGVAIGWSGGEP
ncbi:hypothetical protein IDM40_06700 [Nocardiopsis sp. HNM0947]|uniref:Uncharacterized protein n=1 Tax=Nocardiopsis coralli TaxID=2772213 RepID=A0ABR9P3I6_9ACTN|nr:hypothetical protein [Nocardiopsis coralli]MBE2998396.1 hypothetical protein [Nocardiopsis coralli]